MAALLLMVGPLAGMLVLPPTTAPVAAPLAPVSRTPVQMSCGAPSQSARVFSPAALVDSRPSGASPTPRAIQRAADGLFYIDGRVNGVAIRFLVDTGASTIVLTKADAVRANVAPSEASFNATADTAGGSTTMANIRLSRLAVADAIDFDVPAAVASEGLGVSLLGASWLTQIGSLTITGDRMVLQ